MKTRNITDLPRETQEKYVRAVYGKWTTEPPTKEGWYWAVDNENEIEIVEFTDGELYVTGWENAVAENHFTHWCGPIPAPEPPK
jgi:hypothetical protein